MKKVIIGIILFGLGFGFGYLSTPGDLCTETILFLSPDLSAPLNPYIKVDSILKEISSREYTNKYQCVDFSKDLQKMLRENSIESEIVRGTRNNNGHAWSCIWVEPQTGQFITTAEGYKN